MNAHDADTMSGHPMADKIKKPVISGYILFNIDVANTYTNQLFFVLWTVRFIVLSV